MRREIPAPRERLRPRHGNTPEDKHQREEAIPRAGPHPTPLPTVCLRVHDRSVLRPSENILVFGSPPETWLAGRGAWVAGTSANPKAKKTVSRKARQGRIENAQSLHGAGYPGHGHRRPVLPGPLSPLVSRRSWRSLRAWRDAECRIRVEFLISTKDAVVARAPREAARPFTNMRGRIRPPPARARCRTWGGNRARAPVRPGSDTRPVHGENRRATEPANAALPPPPAIRKPESRSAW